MRLISYLTASMFRAILKFVEQGSVGRPSLYFAISAIMKFKVLSGLPQTEKHADEFGFKTLKHSLSYSL